MPRYSVDLTADEVEQVKAIAASEDRTMASALRCLIRRQLQVGILLESGVIQRQNSVTSASLPQSPDPDPAQAESSTPEKNKSKKDPSLAPLAVSVEILKDLSSHTGKQYKPKLNGKARELIAHRMAQGATLDDFKEVHRKKAQEWLGTEWARFLRPSTLYGTKFGEYLAQPEQREEIDPAVADVMRRCGVDPGAS